MPPSSPPPTPALYSQINQAPLSGTVSGLVPPTTFTSGTSGTGPWFVEEQSLTIHYSRYPLQTTVASHDIKLSGAPTITFNSMGYTGIGFWIEASYSKKKDFGSYTTSSYQHPQTFTVQSQSTDLMGNDYGSVPTSALGPQGVVYTTQNYYKRVPWDNNNPEHVEVSKSVSQAGNQYGATVDGVYGLGVPPTYSIQGLKLGFDNKFNHPLGHPSMINRDEPGLYFADILMPGDYDPNNEGSNVQVNFIELVADKIKNIELYSDTADTTGGTINKTEGFAEYSSTRHQY